MDFNVPIQTAVHVVISLVAIASGAVVAYGFLAAKRLDIWTASFLVTTVLTSVTGFVSSRSSDSHPLSELVPSR